jgi:hypothetical protein
MAKWLRVDNEFGFAMDSDSLEIVRDEETYFDVVKMQERRKKNPRTGTREREKDALGRAKQTSEQERMNHEFDVLRRVLKRLPQEMRDQMRAEISDIITAIRWECARHVGRDEFVEGTLWKELGVDWDELEHRRLSDQRDMLTLRSSSCSRAYA